MNREREREGQRERERKQGSRVLMRNKVSSGI
jgi:hypothetical protein